MSEVSLTIPDGELMVLLGPSGCGKSTTLRMIAGLEAVTSGDIHIGDQRVNDVDPRHRQLAFVFQNYALFPHLTVRGQSRVRDAAARREAGPAHGPARRDRAPSWACPSCSTASRPSSPAGSGSGWRWAGHCLRDPVAFLLDEPLSNLDAKLRASMRTELVKLHRRVGRTIVHVTHDQVEAMTMAQRICIMNEGRVVQVGTPLEVYRSPANTFVAGFLASPPMNLVTARMAGGSDGGLVAEGPGFTVQWPEAERNAYASYRDRRVVVGIRPEDLWIEA